MRGSVLIIDEMHPSIVPGLLKLGFNADYHPEIGRKEILRIIPEYLGLIVRSKTEADRELIDKAVKLKFIARAGAGTDKIDVDYCAERNIMILNSPEGNQDALAEHATGMLLALFNHFHVADAQVRQFVWDREGNRGVELHSKTVGIIGYGHMGSAFAKRLAGFSCHVLAYDKYKTGYEDIYVKESTMDDLFENCDILSLHVPLSDETRRYYNEKFFTGFRKPLWIMNTARGDILPLADLIRLLNTGKILGAALDVLEYENLPAMKNEDKLLFEELIKFKNVILTPHIGGWTHESYKKINDVLLEKIGRLNVI
jgi:D-3-phosphoglycerate dehydrogenase